MMSEICPLTIIIYTHRSDYHGGDHKKKDHANSGKAAYKITPPLC